MIDWNPPGRRQTNKGRSKIRIPRHLMTFLKLARKRGSDLGPVIHVTRSRTIRDGEEEKIEEITAPIADIKKAFNAAAVRAGFATPMVRRDGTPVLDKEGEPRMTNSITPHVLRHTCATWQAQRGVDLWKVAGWLGQSVARTTELYAHHHPDFMRESSDALDRHSVANSVARGRNDKAG